MEKKFEGSVWNGFLMLFLTLGLTLVSIVGAIYGIVQLADEANPEVAPGLTLLLGGLALLVVGRRAGSGLGGGRLA